MFTMPAGVLVGLGLFLAGVVVSVVSAVRRRRTSARRGLTAPGEASRDTAMPRRP
jgi:hypothetical protein